MGSEMCIRDSGFGDFPHHRDRDSPCLGQFPGGGSHGVPGGRFVAGFPGWSGGFGFVGSGGGRGVFHEWLVGIFELVVDCRRSNHRVKRRPGGFGVSGVESRPGAARHRGTF